MTTRLTLVAAAAGIPAREVRFGDDRALDARTVSRITAAASGLPVVERCVTAPSTVCRQTAAALGLGSGSGLDAVEVPELRDLDVGAWRGRALDDVAAADPEGLAAWMSDPSAAPHGGESVEQLCRRIGAWLAGPAVGAGRVLAVAEPAVVRAAITHALGCPPAAHRHIDVPPLAVAQLTEHGGRWNLRLGTL